MVKLKMTAVIPVVQYGNVQPCIELEGEDYKELEAEAMEHIKKLWNKLGEKPFPEEKELGDWKEIITFTGEKIYYNDEIHKYKDENGNALISGSQYAKKFEKEFNKEMISKIVAEKNGLSQKQVLDVWEDNGFLSRTFGTACHKVLENYFRHKESACGEKNYHMPKHPFLKNMLESFPLLGEEIYPELMVSSVSNKMIGQIDGLVVTGDKEGYIIDYKTDVSVEENLPKHFIQLSFYAFILKQFGWNITKIEIWNYVNEWKAYPSEVIDLKTLKS